MEYPQSCDIVVPPPSFSETSAYLVRPHLPLGLLFANSQVSAWLRPCIRTVRFNAPAVLAGAPVHGGVRGRTHSPSRLHAHRDPLCLTLRLLTARHARHRAAIPPAPDLRHFLPYTCNIPAVGRTISGVPSPPDWAEAVQGPQGGHYPRRSLRTVETGR